MGGIERRVQDYAACLFIDAGFPFLFFFDWKMFYPSCGLWINNYPAPGTTRTNISMEHTNGKTKSLFCKHEGKGSTG